MTPHDACDAYLIQECATFHDIFASYVNSCVALAEMEAAGIELHKINEVRHGTSLRWQDALSRAYRVSQTPACTTVGLVAKGSVVQDYFAEHPVDDCDGAELLSSLLVDLANVLT